FRDLAEMMAERGVSIAHTTIMRWVHHYAPEFERRWNRFAQPAGASWRVDETYVKVCGEWVYLYRAVDRAGNTVNLPVRLSRGDTFHSRRASSGAGLSTSGLSDPSSQPSKSFASSSTGMR